MNQLSVTIVTPTFNSMRTIKDYMEAICAQDYPHHLMDIVFADGGSSDGTLEYLKNYSCDFLLHFFSNPLRTAEAGKAVAVKQAVGDVILLLDSDNIIPDTNWLNTSFLHY